MAAGKFKYDNAKVTLNSVDLSAFVRSVTFNLRKPLDDISAMGNTGGRVYHHLIEEGEFTIEFFDSYYAAEVDATLAAIAESATAVAFIIDPMGVGATATANKPTMTGNCRMPDYQFTNATYGETATKSATFTIDGGATRNVS